MCQQGIKEILLTQRRGGVDKGSDVKNQQAHQFVM
jgi:hypothetical protein